MIGDDKAGIKPWTAIPQGPTRDLLYAYESVLTEMRTHARGSTLIAGWVDRLDAERDEFVREEFLQVLPTGGTDDG